MIVTSGVDILTSLRVWLIGESNPYSDDPADALLPYPDESAGYRLCVTILGMSRAAYLRAFERRNLVVGDGWSVPVARLEAARLQLEVAANDAVVLLGEKVARAWLGQHLAWSPFTTRERNGVRYLTLPHPSGRSRLWNPSVTPGAFAKARHMVVELAPWLAEVIQ